MRSASDSWSNSRKFAIYYYLALVGDEEVERVTRDVREQMNNEPHIVEALTRRGVQGHEPALYDLLVAVAEMPELAHLRRQLAPAIIKTVIADLEFETVNLRPGEIAMDLLGSRPANTPKPADTQVGSRRVRQ